MSAYRNCAVEHCKRPVQHGHLMRREHWRRVPRDMQGEVNDAWKAYRRAILTTPPDATTSSTEKIDLANRYRFVAGEAARIAAREPAVPVVCETCGVDFFGPPGTTKCHRHREASA